jgi:Domain of unknown function (DUF1772)
MFQSLQVLTVVLVAVALSFAVTHVAELPGKLRLDKATYTAVHAIYYPGFMIGGISEPGSIVALVVLLALTPRASPAFGWTLAALVCLVAMQLVFWLATQPVNGFWLKDRKLSSAGTGFFSIGRGRTAPDLDWTSLRDRWEQSHLLRAVLALLGLVFLAIAMTSR